MKAKIYISYKEGILDPQGKTISHALDTIGIKNSTPCEWVNM